MSRFFKFFRVSNFQISTRLWLWSIPIFLTLLIMGFFISQRMLYFQKSFEEINQTARGRYQVLNLLVLVSQIQMAPNDFLLTHDPTEKERFEKLLAKIDSYFAILEKSNRKTAEEQNLLIAIKNNYLAMKSKAVSIFGNQDFSQSESIKLMKEIDAISTETTQLVNAWQQLVMNDLAQMQIHYTEVRRQIIFFYSGLSLFLFLMALFFGIIFFRLMKKSLLNLTDIANRIARGETGLTPRPIFSGNEMDALAQSFNQIEKINRMKDEFVSLVSHQLLTPLTAINWYAETLLGKEKIKKGDKINYLKKIHESSQRMSRLINDLLNVSRLNAGEIKIEPRPFQLEDLILEIIQEFQALAKTKNCVLVFEKQSKKMSEILVDPNILRQILSNLLNNAIRYSPCDKKCQVVVSLGAQDKNYLISVADHGIGIPADTQKRVFEKFFRADNARKFLTDGTGLGLYISKTILKFIGGEIWFKSKEGEGSTFYFTIPGKGMKKAKGRKLMEPK